MQAAETPGTIFGGLFLAHPRSVGETYPQHLRAALSFAALLAWASAACLVHAFVPALFPTRASRQVAALHERMLTNRRRLGALGAELDWAI